MTFNNILSKSTVTQPGDDYERTEDDVAVDGAAVWSVTFYYLFH